MALPNHTKQKYGRITCLKWKSKQHAKLYVLVYQVTVFDFFPRKNTLYKVDRLIKHPSPSDAVRKQKKIF